MGLLQKDASKMMDVCTASIVGWENKSSTPEISLIPKIIKFLGYIPFNQDCKTIKDKLILYRKITGMNHRKLAALIGIDPSTIATWEKEEHKPTKRLLKKLNEFFGSVRSDY